MSAISLQGNASGTGTLTIAAPSTNTNRTLTLPDNTGTLLSTGSTFAGTGPAFSAYLSADQTVTTSVATKVAFNTEVFDTASAYDNATNYRFTPLVSGYYQVNSTVSTTGTTTQSVYINSIYKNGVVYRNGVQTAITFSATGTNGFSVSDLIFMNGTTDYLEIYCRIDGTGTMKFISGAAQSSFSAVLVRSAV